VEGLNYHHLRYFWAAAREGSVTRASAKLRVSQPAVSAQIRSLEQALGEKLFARSGRTLALTEAGRVVFRYAEEIFGLGAELVETLKGRPTGRPLRLLVGIVNVIPKLIAHRLLEPAFRLPERVHVVCLEDRPDRLLAELASHRLDLVLADAPAGASVRVRAYSHLLGECGVSIFGTPRLAKAHRRGFPRSLDGAPFLLPTADSTLRRQLDHWFETLGIRPEVVGQFEDTALLKVLGQSGAGLFAVPSAIEAEVRRQYGVWRLGRIEIRERFYAITVQRKLRHPAVVAISEAARRELFVGAEPPAARGGVPRCAA
jgi:LysR family transcriptional activator of nhaA